MLAIPRCDIGRNRKGERKTSSDTCGKCSGRSRSEGSWGNTIGANTRIGAGSVVVRNVDADSTVVGIPGRIIHQSGVRVNPLAHSALPDAEANVIRNLMERIDELEGTVRSIKKHLGEITGTQNTDDTTTGESQNLKDKEIIDYIGEKGNYE